MPRDKTGHFYFEWYSTIFKADTQNLALAEDGAYRRLIDHYMETRAPLPSDDKALARIIGVGWTEWEEVKDAVIKYFKPSINPAGFLIHSFCDEILAIHKHRISISKNNGKKGGRPKGSKNKANNPAGYGNETQRKPITEQNNINKEDNPPAPHERGTRWKHQPLPLEFLEYATAQKCQMKFIMLQYEKFQNYWSAKAGNGAIKLDWLATWRNWILTAMEGSPNATNHQINTRSAENSKTSRAKAAVNRAAESGGFAARPVGEAAPGGDDISELPIT